MVWHAYQLNPRAFFEDCLRFGKINFWRAGFPWERINAAIDNDTFQLKTSKLEQTMWKFNTGFEWDSLIDSPKCNIKCPQCKIPLEVPWTGWTTPAAFAENTDNFKPAGELFKGEMMSEGYADKNFRATCNSCRITFARADLQLLKFRWDFYHLTQREYPMPGTILDEDGKLQPVHPHTQLDKDLAFSG